MERRTYRSGDASDFRLVVSATGIAEVDGAVFADADAAGIWVNAADDRAHSSFILPAVHRDGAVTVSVSTGGLSPALAAWLRTRIATQVGDGLGTVAELLAEARARLHAEGVRERVGRLDHSPRRPPGPARASGRVGRSAGNSLGVNTPVVLLSTTSEQMSKLLTPG